MKSTLTALVLVASVLIAGARSVDAQATIIPFGTGAVVEHRVRVAGETERVAGAIWGAGVSFAVEDWWGAQVRISSGTLTGRSPNAEGRSVSEASIAAILVPDSWVTLDVGPRVRAVRTSLATQRWIELNAGAELGLELLDGQLRGTIRASIAPSVSVSGQPAPDLSIGAGTGLEYISGRLSARLTYSLDRYDFPLVAGQRRLEQHSALLAMVGWQIK
jgi:hypothetical protein